MEFNAESSDLEKYIFFTFRDFQKRATRLNCRFCLLLHHAEKSSPESVCRQNQGPPNTSFSGALTRALLALTEFIRFCRLVFCFLEEKSVLSNSRPIQYFSLHMREKIGREVNFL